MAYYFQHPSSMHSNSSHGQHHGGRSRRQPRLASQNSNRSFRGVRSMKDLPLEPVNTFSAEFVTKWEAARSFDLDDDMEFCPNLLTDEDLSSMSSGSDRSSLSSNSPNSSPLQSQIQPSQSVSATPSFSLSSTAASFTSSNYSTPMKIHQPAATRIRNPIAIVNPETKLRLSPPVSISPGRMQQNGSRRW